MGDIMERDCNTCIKNPRINKNVPDLPGCGEDKCYNPSYEKWQGIRLDPEVFNLPVNKIQMGHYTDVYFNRTREILVMDRHNPNVTMQVFQKNDAVLGGIDEAIAILKLCTDDFNELEVYALYDGDKVKPFEPVMHIEGPYQQFAHLETVYLGVMARRTRVATNTVAVVKAARGKPIMFFPARFDHHMVQTGDGYAAHIAGAIGVSTDAQASWWGGSGIGTIPHALIAAYEGDTIKATIKFAEMFPDVNCISLVDYDNDCVVTSLAVASAMKIEGRKLYGVRLDTGGTMVDASIVDIMGQFKPTGVNPKLVWNVRNALDKHGHEKVKIFVSGGFTPEKIRHFEGANVPADGYGVGSSLLKGNFDFTADIVMNEGYPTAKVGREFIVNNRLEKVV